MGWAFQGSSVKLMKIRCLIPLGHFFSMGPFLSTFTARRLHLKDNISAKARACAHQQILIDPNFLTGKILIWVNIKESSVSCTYSYIVVNSILGIRSTLTHVVIEAEGIYIKVFLLYVPRLFSFRGTEILMKYCHVWIKDFSIESDPWAHILDLVLNNHWWICSSSSSTEEIIFQMPCSNIFTFSTSLT